MKKCFRFLLLIPLAAMLSGCFYAREIGISEASESEAREYYGISGSTSEGLSFESRNYLQSNLLMPLCRTSPDELIRLLSEEFQKTGNREILGTKADVCYNCAVETDDPDSANRYYLAAAYAYYTLLFDRNFRKAEESGRFDPLVIRAAIRYNAATGQIFKYLKSRGLLEKKAFHLPSADGNTISFPAFPVSGLPKLRDGYEDFLLCSDFKTEKLTHFSFRFGIGAPLIAVTRDASGSDKTLKLAKDLALSATCVLRFHTGKNGERTATIEFHDTVKSDSLRILGEPVPLTQDFSTPIAYFVNHRDDLNLLTYMLNPDHDSFSGLYAMSPYDPDKIPVIFVHGLMSSPQTWIQMINTLSSDPGIRSHYQFWFYTYSSGNPVLVSAEKMREAVDAVWKQYGRNRNFNRMVIVGHSMGGLLAKTFALDSGDALLTKLIGRVWSEVKQGLRPEEIQQMEKLAVFHQREYVSRIVFMAVPHKGSEMADWSIARWGASLISLPVKMVRNAAALAAKLIPGGNAEEITKKHLQTGIDNLSPDNPVMKGLAGMPLSKRIVYHSIIGNNRKAGVPGGTDGVVKYESSHLDQAESEQIVKSGHSVQTNPETIRELVRILNEHLAQKTPSSPDSAASRQTSEN